MAQLLAEVGRSVRPVDIADEEIWSELVGHPIWSELVRAGFDSDPGAETSHNLSEVDMVSLTNVMPRHSDVLQPDASGSLESPLGVPIGASSYLRDDDAGDDQGDWPSQESGPLTIGVESQ